MLGEPDRWDRGVSRIVMPFCLYNRPLTMRLDLNADVGESFGPYSMGHDAGLMTSITSANVAAGFHAGDPSVLRDTIRLAKQHGVAVGAHPGFPDLVGFGRRELNVTPREAEDMVLYQVAAVAGVATQEVIVRGFTVSVVDRAFVSPAESLAVTVTV